MQIRLQERDLRSVCKRRRVAGSGTQSLAGVSEGLINKDKDEAANRGGLPTLRALFFFQGNAKIRSGYPGSPQVAPGEPASIV